MGRRSGLAKVCNTSGRARALPLPLRAPYLLDRWLREHVLWERDWYALCMVCAWHMLRVHRWMLVVGMGTKPREIFAGPESFNRGFNIGLAGGGMRAKMEAGCGMQEILRDGMQDKNTSAGAGFAHFDRRDAGWIKIEDHTSCLTTHCKMSVWALCLYSRYRGAHITPTGITQNSSKLLQRE